jgi:polar amino acid transport system substrate-binding protein
MRALAVLMFCLSLSAAASAQPGPTDPTPPAPAAGAKLHVYTKPIEPFAFQKDGKDRGFSLDLWDRIAKKLGVQYEIHWTKSVSDLIDAVKAKQADVAIAAISITAGREKVIDFTTPFYESGLAILTRAEGKGVFDLMKETFWTAGVGKAVLVVLLAFVVLVHGVWFFERKVNPEQFPKPYAKGIWESSWWAISTILSGGCDAKGPMHTLGRVLGALWMLVCIVVLTYFTAAITTMMTVNQLSSSINGPGDLPGKTVATVKGSTAEKYLLEHGVKVTPFDAIGGALDAMNAKKVDAVVYDEPILAYHAKVSGQSGQTVVGLFERQNYGIAVQTDSPLRKQINTVLLELAEDGTIDELRAKWFAN